MYKIYPEPIHAQMQEGSFPPVSAFDAVIDESILSQCSLAGFNVESALHGLCTHDSQAQTCRFLAEKKEDMHAEGYRLLIDASGITVHVKTGAGLYYALQTLRQLSGQCGGGFPFMDIQDYPSLDIRGVMLDIGRNKIPSLDTMYALLDMLSVMRINHVQFYMEGYCYQYKNYPYLVPTS